MGAVAACTDDSGVSVVESFAAEFSGMSGLIGFESGEFAEEFIDSDFESVPLAQCTAIA